MAKVSFRTNVLLKSIIGKDLITDDNIAVLELVKNAFDAGSSESKIVFKDIIHNQELKEYKKKNNSKIIITDFGVGMSEYDLINKWLNIAYSEKKKKKEEYNRTLAGNKGVGRFSCDRLGKQLTIYTRQKGESFIKLVIDWTKFEKIDDIDLNIQDIQFDLDKISESQFKTETGIISFEQGTILSIESLREEWNHKKLLSLRRQLERLINPNQSFKSEKFDIIIQADELKNEDSSKPDYQKVLGEIKNKIFEKLNFKVTNIHSKISNNGKEIITTLKDRRNIIFTITEENKFSLLKDIDIYIYYLNPYSKAYFTKQTGIRSVDFGSISLFINGFRIPPYGDEGNDWLGMELRKGQGYSRYLGTREVIGRIEIKDENENFKIISNRSGVVNDNYYKELTKSSSPWGYYYKIFRRLERFVVEGIKWDSTPEDEVKLEKKILNDPNWKESDEQYNEDSLTRNKRILEVVEKIIDAKKSDIISLDINRNFVSKLVTEQTEKIKTEINSIAEEIKNKDLTSLELNELLSKINVSKQELDQFPEKGISNNNTFQKIQLEQTNLENKLKKHQEEKLLLEKAIIEAENKALEIAEELELEKEKNTYLRTSSRSLTEDAKGLVHNIKITSKKISDSVDNLYHKVLEDNYTKNHLLKSLGAIKFQAEKANKISKIITRSNFNADKTAQIADVALYIEQYIAIYSEIYPKSDLKFNVENEASFEKKFSLLDMSVVLDDLISNAEKAFAKIIQIQMSNPKEDEILIIFSDNGNGVPEKFLKDEKSKEKIFELGITTTQGGSGIGLNSVRSGLKLMKGTIKFLGNNILLKGACFEIRIK